MRRPFRLEILRSIVPSSTCKSWLQPVQGIEMSGKRIAWAMTGAGHALRECVDLLLNCENSDLFLSRAAREVLVMYGLYERIESSRLNICRDDAESTPTACRFAGGAYSVLVVAPATSNSVAKFVHGISDTLVTNIFAQAGKSRVPIVVYPTDFEQEVSSFGPNGEPVKVYPRPVDLDNTRTLSRFEGIKIAFSREELERCLAGYL